jgi:hypothetical protein
MSDRPRYMVVVVNDGEPGLKIVSAHAAKAAAEGMMQVLAGLMADSALVYLVPLPDADAIIGTIIAPVAGAIAQRAGPARQGGALPQAPSVPVVPFRRITAEQFEAETRAMMEGGMADMPWRDADAPLGEGGAVG